MIDSLWKATSVKKISSATVNTEDQIIVQRDIDKNFSGAWTFSLLWRKVFKMSFKAWLRGQYKYMYLGYSDGVRFRWLVLPENFLSISVSPRKNGQRADIRQRGYPNSVRRIWRDWRNKSI